MRVVAPSSEEEMVAVFLRGELESSRFGPALRGALQRASTNARVVTHPLFDDGGENELRLRLLDEMRAYVRRHGLFGGFPDDVCWQRVALTPDELASVRYIRYDYWIELSGGSRLATEAARRIRAGIEVFGVSNDGFLELADELATGAAMSELILVTTGGSSSLVVLEGHARLTALALRPDVVPPELVVLCGTSAAMKSWWLW
jgi:hypothetical protein